MDAREMFARIAKCAGYSVRELSGKSRKRDVVDRRIAVTCIMHDMGASLSEIARLLNRTKGIPGKLYLPLRPYVKDEIERIRRRMDEA